MEDIVHSPRDMDKFGHIVMEKLKPFQMEQVFNVLQVSCNKVVHANDVVAFGNKSIAKV
jgi:pyruvate/2-oxoacid:ferredoxin oxidoreductase alpha subunit